MYFPPLLCVLFWSAKTKGTRVQSSCTLSVCYGIQTSSFCYWCLNPVCSNLMFFSCESCFFSKHKERTVQLLFSLIALEKKVGELHNMLIPRMFQLAFVGLVNPSGGCATEISYSLSQCEKYICQFLKYYIQCHKWFRFPKQELWVALQITWAVSICLSSMLLIGFFSVWWISYNQKSLG